jgi:hypothetical protein
MVRWIGPPQPTAQGAAGSIDFDAARTGYPFTLESSETLGQIVAAFH